MSTAVHHGTLVKSQLLYQLSYAGAAHIVFGPPSMVCRQEPQRTTGVVVKLLSKLESSLDAVLLDQAGYGSDRHHPWPPSTEGDLRIAVTEGALEERHKVDVKREIPPGDNANREPAKDLASFVIDGGRLIVGIDESAGFALTPVDLKGPGDRIDMVAHFPGRRAAGRRNHDHSSLIFDCWCLTRFDKGSGPAQSFLARWSEGGQKL